MMSGDIQIINTTIKINYRSKGSLDIREHVPLLSMHQIRSSAFGIEACHNNQQP